MDERAHHHLIIPQQDKYGGGGHLKTNALLLVEWSIYHGLKWCLSPTKVLIIPSEEELPAHYLPGNNNADTRPPGPPPGLPGVACRSLSAAAPFIQSQQAASCRIHSPSCTISPSFQPLSPYAASHYLPALCRLPPPPSHPLLLLPGQALDTHFLPFCEPALPHPSTPLGPDEPL